MNNVDNNDNSAGTIPISVSSLILTGETEILVAIATAAI